MKRSILRMVGVAVLTAATVVLGSGPASAEIKFGTLPRLSAAELQTMYAPLAGYLAKETGEKVSIVVPKTFDDFKRAVKAGQIDIGFANPLVYVQVKEQVDVEPLALSSDMTSGTRLRGIIIVRKDSGINSLQDLRSKKISFMAKDSPAAYLFQVLLLSKAGLVIHKDFTVLPFAKRHDKIIKEVLDKTADAGAVREDEFEKMKNSADFSQLRIIGYTEYLPNWPAFATPKLNKAMANKIRAALLKLKPNDPQNEKILGLARLTGFIPVADKEYDGLRAAAKVAGAM